MSATGSKSTARPVKIEPGCLTIGVAAHGNVAGTAKCLKSIFSAVEGDFELLLVNDASPDRMLELFLEAKSIHPRTQIFSFQENKEYSHSVNCILTQARTEYILFVSNDIFIVPAYIRGLLSGLADSSVGIARGVSNFVDGPTPSSLHTVSQCDSVHTNDDLLNFSEQLFRSAPEKPVQDAYLTGDAFITRRLLVERIGGFDTAFHGYFSDIDFGVRAAHAGVQKVICRRAFAWHDQGGNMKYLPEDQHREKVARRIERVSAAWKVFREKWGLFDLPENWYPEPAKVFSEISFQHLDSLAFDPRKDCAQRVDYSQYIVS
jgi:GT2 family glycosyltransferase